MQEVQLSRQRNGAYGCRIARDIADPETLDRALSLPRLARLYAPAHRTTQPSARCISARWILSRARPVRVRRMLDTAVRIGALEGRHDRPRANEVCRRHGGGQQ